MSAPVIDLGAARTKRAADLQAATEATQTVLDNVAEIARDYASLAFSVSGPIWLVSQRFAIDINRSQWRQLRSSVRRMTRKAQPGVRAQLLEWAEAVFTDQLAKLAAQRDAKRVTA